MKAMVCTRCLTVGKPKQQTRGSFLVEVLLWLCFLFPGLLYSLWRLSSKYEVCKQCGSRELVPANSVRGKQLRGMTD